jgi:predicted unusual protein kinase regulating ubiquinone biosynthesis (AarF/ABC1/UbiB family)
MGEYDDTVVSREPIKNMVESGMPNYYKVDAIHSMVVAAMNKDRRTILQMITDMKLVEPKTDFDRGFNSALDSIFHIVYSGEYRS